MGATALVRGMHGALCVCLVSGCITTGQQRGGLPTSDEAVGARCSTTAAAEQPADVGDGDHWLSIEVGFVGGRGAWKATIYPTGFVLLWTGFSDYVLRLTSAQTREIDGVLKRDEFMKLRHDCNPSRRDSSLYWVSVTTDQGTRKVMMEICLLWKHEPQNRQDVLRFARTWLAIRDIIARERLDVADNRECVAAIVSADENGHSTVD